MIDTIYKTALTIMNKENQGYLSPTEYNLIINNIQMEIFREYFEDENRDKNKENRGLANYGYSNLPFNQRQRIEQFSAIDNITPTVIGDFELPEDLYLIEDKGISVVSSDENYNGVVVEQVERNQINYLRKSEAAPTSLYPVYERYGNVIRTFPTDLPELEVRYLRTPKEPKWTYFVLPNGKEMFDPSNPSFQDLELHISEFSNIVIRLLSYFGITIREEEVVKVAETLKDKGNLKDNQ